MTWTETYLYIPKYEYVSTNQHGDRYKRIGTKRIHCAKLSTNTDSAGSMTQLILLSHHLNVPVHYDFETDPQTAYIEVVAKEGIPV